MNIFNGLFPVCYGQFYFLSEAEWSGDLRACFSSQTNGLCGVSVEGVVFFITGLHTGNITLSIDYFESEPKLDDSKEEVVDASFTVPESGLTLEAWGEELTQNIDLRPGSYRMRYSAVNFGLAEDLGKFEEGDIEIYSIEIWPAPCSEDKIVKATRESAKYWHSHVEKHQA